MCSVPMRELSNPGASGSIFYLTDDDEFIVKTVQHKECEFLQKLLPGYYMNLNQNPRTLLPKFFGLFNYQCNSKNIRLVVMNNLLPSSVRMHQKYDLKGSTYKRKVRYCTVPKTIDCDLIGKMSNVYPGVRTTCFSLYWMFFSGIEIRERKSISNFQRLGLHGAPS